MPLEVPGSSGQCVGNYELLQKIAEGGMGSVYKGRHRETGQIVAIKILAPRLVKNATLLKRFEKEWRTAHSLDHPNIVRALEFGYTGSLPYLVMEYVDGESLGRRLDRVGRLPEAEAIRIIAQVARGLHKAHKNKLIHRDIKPDNILLASDGTAKIADLGLVRELDDDTNLTRTGRGLGTPYFMAPEQFCNAKQADVRCDIYSLGATLYMAVTGELPFRSPSPLEVWMRKRDNDFPSPRSLVPSLSERTDWAIRRAMSADPQHRPASCREFVEDLTGRSTRHSVTLAAEQPSDLWYLQYEDEQGQRHTVKGTLANIRRCLKDGLLGDAENISVSRSRQGPYQLLRNQPEFRDLVIRPASLPDPKPAPKISGPVSRDTASPSARSTAPTEEMPYIGPAYRAPAIDLGPVQPRPARNENLWLWLLTIGFIVVGFLAGLLFLTLVLPQR
jgi:serine/threonine protein kinase